MRLGGQRTILSCSDQNLDVVIDLARHAAGDRRRLHRGACAGAALSARAGRDAAANITATISEQVDIGIALWSHPDSGYLMSPELCARIAEIAQRGRDQVQRAAGDVRAPDAACRRQALVSTASEEEWLDNIVELGWRLYLCSSPPYSAADQVDRRMREYTDLAFARRGGARQERCGTASIRCAQAFKRTRPAEKFHAHQKYWQELLGQVGGAVRRPLLELTPSGEGRDPRARCRDLRPQARARAAAFVGGVNSTRERVTMTTEQLTAKRLQGRSTSRIGSTRTSTCSSRRSATSRCLRTAR